MGTAVSARLSPGTWPSATAPAACSWSAAGAQRATGAAELIDELEAPGAEGRGPRLRCLRPRAAGRAPGRSTPSTPSARSSTPPGCSTTVFSRPSTPSAGAVFAPKADRRLAPARADQGPGPLRLHRSSPRSPARWAIPPRPTTPLPTPFSTPSPRSAAPRAARHLDRLGPFAQAAASRRRPRAAADAGPLAPRRSRAAWPPRKRWRSSTLLCGPRNPSLASARLNRHALRTQAADGRLLPPILSGLVRIPASRTAARPNAGRREPRRMPDGRADEELRSLDRGPRQCRGVLGHASGAAVEATRPSRSSASTRWPRSSCATVSVAPPAYGCRADRRLRLPHSRGLGRASPGPARPGGGAAATALDARDRDGSRGTGRSAMAPRLRGAGLARRACRALAGARQAEEGSKRRGDHELFDLIDIDELVRERARPPRPLLTETHASRLTRYGRAHVEATSCATTSSA